jgi:cytochrome c biogenesis protein CcdA
MQRLFLRRRSTGFGLCAGFDLVFPHHAMYEVWRKLLPGFEWISWPSFIRGLAESFGYGWYFALIWVPLYNYFLCNFGLSDTRQCIDKHQAK